MCVCVCVCVCVCKNKKHESLFDGCSDSDVATGLEHYLVFPTEIMLMTKRLDIVILSIKLKKILVIELMVSFEENFNWVHQCRLEKYKAPTEKCVINDWITSVFPIEVGCWGLINNSSSTLLTNLALSLSDKRKYIKKSKSIMSLCLHGFSWLSYHSSLLSIIFSKSSRLHPVAIQSC